MPRHTRAHWSYVDLGLFFASILPIYFLSAVLVSGVRAIAPSALASDGARILALQTALYLLLLGSLYLVLRTKYDEPFWPSLGWSMAFRWSWLYLLAAPVLAFGTSVLGGLLRAPVIVNPADQLLGQVPPALVAILVTIVGPMFEELIFRGFVQPVLTRTLGPVLGIAGAALPFALLHGPQYEWSWQHLLIVFLAGATFGLARYLSGSTAASALMHMGYNFTLFAAELLQRKYGA